MPDDASLFYPTMAAQAVPAPPSAAPADPAAAMYPSMQQPAPEALAEPAPFDDLRPAEEVLYPEKDAPSPLIEVPPEVQALRDDPLRQMYGAQVEFKRVIADEDFVVPEGEDPALATQAARELREIAADIGLSAPDAQMLRDRIQIAKHNTAPIPDQHDACVDALNAEFGMGAKQALLDARALLRRDPRAAAVIEHLGLGNDPQTVLMIARKAQQARRAGKLK